MSDAQPTWATFVRWASAERQFATHDTSIERLIRSEDAARVALALCAFVDDQSFDEALARFTAEHGSPVRCASAAADGRIIHASDCGWWRGQSLGSGSVVPAGADERCDCGAIGLERGATAAPRERLVALADELKAEGDTSATLRRGSGHDEPFHEGVASALRRVPPSRHHR